MVEQILIKSPYLGVYVTEQSPMNVNILEPPPKLKERIKGQECLKKFNDTP